MRDTLRQWNYDIHEYESYYVPDEWDCRWYGTDMTKVINCCQCGKEPIFTNGRYAKSYAFRSAWRGISYQRNQKTIGCKVCSS